MASAAARNPRKVVLDANQTKWGTLLREQFLAIDQAHVGRTKTLAVHRKKALYARDLGALKELYSVELLAEALRESQFTVRAYREIANWPEDVAIFFDTPNIFPINLAFDVKRLIQKFGNERIADVARILAPSTNPGVKCTTRLKMMKESLSVHVSDVSKNHIIKKHFNFVISFNSLSNAILVQPTDPLKAEFFAEKIANLLTRSVEETHKD